MKRSAAIGWTAGAGLLLALVAMASASEAPEDTRPPQSPPAPPAEPPPAEPPEDEKRKELIRLSREGRDNTGLAIGTSTLTQKDVTDAVWHNFVDNDPLPLAAVAKELPQMSLAMQTYTLAAANAGKLILRNLDDWKKEFDKAQRKLAEDLDQQDREFGAGVTVGTAVIGAGIAAGLAAANTVPVVGQVLTALVALGVALYVGFKKGFKPPLRNADDQVLRTYFEGKGQVFAGLQAQTEQENPYRNANSTRQMIQEDWVGSQLPLVLPGTQFFFVPTLKQFQAAGHEVGIYPGDK